MIDAPPSSELRLLCCEGACSPLLAVFLEREALRQAVGYSRSSNRAHESAALVHTPHYFVRTYGLAETTYHLWACASCGHERTYGAEEA